MITLYIHTYIHTYTYLKNKDKEFLKQEKIVRNVKKEKENIIKPVLGYG